MTTQKQIHWRRAKIIELLAQGYSQTEVAQTLQVDDATISKDMTFLRNQSRETIQHYTTKQVPLQFRVATRALQKAVHMYSDIAENSHDNQEKMQAIELYLECHHRLTSWLVEAGGRMEKFLIEHDVSGNGNGKSKLGQVQHRRLPHHGDMITPKDGCSSWIYQERYSDNDKKEESEN